jgi:hypothetical protein
MNNTFRVLVCGTGAGSHVLAGAISAQPDVELCIYTRNSQKALEWSDTLRHHRLVTKVSGAVGEITANSFVVTSDPEQAARGCDMVIIALPAFAHAGYLAALAPHLERGCVIVGLPGQCGFEYEVRQILGDRFDQFAVLDFDSLPWVCWLEEFGRTVCVGGIKKQIFGAMREALGPSRVDDPVSALQRLLGKPPRIVVSGHFLGVTLQSVNGSFHPPIMYSYWVDWDGVAIDHEPLIYETISEDAVLLVDRMSQEIMATAAEIMRARLDVDLSDVVPRRDWIIRSYGSDVKDKSSLISAIRSNTSYAGLRHPMTQMAPGKFVPDFHHRFLAEDIPFGLAVLRGISEIAGVPTPTIDMVLRWSQERLGREYLTEEGLIGPDVATSRCPQRYGLATLTDLVRS